MSEIETRERTPETGTAQALYVLHVLAPFTAWLLAVIAIFVAMATRDAVRGTWVDSHYSWLARTFWFGLLWIVVAAVLTPILFIFLMWWVPWTILFLWYLYRVIRGWILLNDRKPAPL